jgi:hypothetical protein
MLLIGTILSINGCRLNKNNNTYSSKEKSSSFGFSSNLKWTTYKNRNQFSEKR